MASNFHFSSIFHHLQVQVLKKLDFTDFVHLAESSHCANQLIDTAHIQPIKEIPALYIGHLYEGDNVKQLLPKYSLSLGIKGGKIPKTFPSAMTERTRFGVETIMFVQLTDLDCLQTIKMFEEGKILNHEQLAQEQNHPTKTRQTATFIPLGLNLKIIHLNTRTCQPTMFFRLLEVLKPKSLSLHHCDKYFLSQQLIRKIGDFHLEGNIAEDLLMSLEAPRLRLYHVNWKEDCFTGVNRLLKEWYTGKRAIENLVFRLDDVIELDKLFDGLPYAAEQREDLPSDEKENAEKYPLFAISAPHGTINVESVKPQKILNSNVAWTPKTLRIYTLRI